jgi:hypothetical protein
MAFTSERIALQAGSGAYFIVEGEADVLVDALSGPLR